MLHTLRHYEQLECLIKIIGAKLSNLPEKPFGPDFIFFYPNRHKKCLSDTELHKLVGAIEDVLQYGGDESFMSLLRTHMKGRGFNTHDVYSSALIERSYFYQILSGKYLPSRDTAIRICLSLELSLDESKTLLQTLGHCFYEKNRRDIIVMECLNFSAGLYYAEVLLERYNEMSLCNKSILHSQEFS